MAGEIERAQVLISQNRWDLAEEHLRQSLAADPENPLAHALLALSLTEREKHAEALKEARASCGRWWWGGS